MGQALVVLALIWVALNGLDGWWLGLLAASAGAVAGAMLASGQPHPWRPHRLAGFALFFLVESFKGGMDVAWRALKPDLPIQPEFRRYRLDLPGGQPRTLMVSVISLLPGTLSADLSDDGRELVVHLLMPEAMDSVSRLDRRIRHLFSLEPRESADE
ncbi:Na+/H+ antiporter subunit E [Wenzhouxiangella sp. AB-CW3]|nr:Na+/H+ antiporter subunit E [Wenzhouxiangella sp. AB-CW3]